MKSFIKLFATLFLMITLTAMATEPPKVRSCIVSQCVAKYYACNPKDNNQCRPNLTSQQRYVLDAYQLCQTQKVANCQHPGISSELMSRLTEVNHNFNQCRQNCYKQFATDLYQRIFEKN